MIKNISLASSLLLLLACNSQKASKTSTQPMSDLTYPVTAKHEEQLDFFGTKVSDPYMWLENDTSAETGAWVAAQNKISKGLLSGLPMREALKTRITELINFEKVGTPVKVGDSFLIYKNSGLEAQGKYFIRKGLTGTDELFLDMNTLSANGTTSASMLSPSEDGKFVPFAISEGGSDWSKIVVFNVETKQQTGDILEWVKFSDASWYNDGFYYSRYPAPEKGAELSGNNLLHTVYFHKLGTPQSEDQLIYQDAERPYMYNSLFISENKKYAFLVSSPGTDGSEIWYRPAGASSGAFMPLFTNTSEHNSVVDVTEDGRILMQTDVDAPTYRLVSVDPNKPTKENWIEIIPAGENMLQGVGTGGGKLIASYLDKANTRIFISDMDGKNRTEIALPDKTGSAGGFGAKRGDKTCFYSFSSFTYPGVIYQYDFASGKSTEFYRANLKFDPTDFESKQVMYPSIDGTLVPMFIVHKKGIKLDGTNPTLLYGYGGFSVPIQPGFSASRIMFLENGGVYCIANIRGGNELGENWHQMGMKDKKQNVFDDFISAAEYLIKEKYTSSEHLAIQGGSNGGLLVGACMTQRPELFKVAIPQVGVLDMLRFHKFTVGKGWIPEYGCADNSKEEFDFLYKYSPYHNLKKGVKYPATLVMTADHDDRVVPAHSFKFAARLQEYNAGNNPVIIRIDTSAGHGSGKSTMQSIEELADVYSFILSQTK
jgi:prolyl oligopeptidase